MVCITMPRIGFGEAWRNAARDLLQRGVPPSGVSWLSEGDEHGLFDGQPLHASSLVPVVHPTVPKPFLPLAAAAVCHSGPERFSLTCRVLWRLQANRDLLLDRADPDVAALCGMEKSVRRDNHKMHAFVRFREIGMSVSGRRQFGAWF